MPRKTEDQLTYPQKMNVRNFDGLFRGLLSQLHASIPPTLERAKIESDIMKLNEKIVEIVQDVGNVKG